MDDLADDSRTVTSELSAGEDLVAGRYRLRARLGSGASKDVYLAYDERLDREVALAIVVGGASSEAARTRVQREAQVTGHLGDHQNIITVYDTGEHDGVPYLVLRAMRGGSLADLIQRRRQSIDSAIRFGREIAAALAHAHAHGVVHRDVKPDNVWLTADGAAALGDFGIASRRGFERLTAEGVVIGTVRYLSPEQINGDDVGAASDLYALGITLYELVTGRPPFVAAEPAQVLAQHLATPPAPPSELEASVPPALERLILRMLAKQPAQRPASAADVEAELAAMIPIVPTSGSRHVLSAPQIPTISGSELSRALIGPGALPAPVTTLFGRGTDLEKLAGLIGRARSNVVTLVGPGGVGKTRLAIEAAKRVAAEYDDGVRFVALASVAEPRDLASAIVRALGAPLRDGEPPMATLHRYLGDRHLLLVLDNFEHLVAEAWVVSELLAGCRDLTVLVTSREPTRLAAERLYPVRPLDVPEQSNASIGELELCGAVKMFVDRARARDPDFTVNATNAQHVREICRRLDGLPLALELAAARIGLLSPAELAIRLDRALSLLAGGARDAPQRHRTLRATIDWSFGLLTIPEREAFMLLAIFASGATVAAAEIVTGASLDTLDSLVAKQLVIRREERLLMLETVREYALERVAEDPAADAAQERLARWCLQLAQRATPQFVHAGRTAALARLDAELPNMLAALSWALVNERTQLALQLATQLGVYWWRTGQSASGIVWMDAALEHADNEPAQARAQALLTRARVIGLRQAQRHHADLHASIELFRACDDAAGMAACLCDLADSAAWHGRFETAMALTDEAMHFAERAHDDGVIALVLAQRAYAATGYDARARLARPAVEQLRRAGNIVEVGKTCTNIGYAAIVDCRYREALPWLTEAVEAGHLLGDAATLFAARTDEGLAQLLLDELDEAERSLTDALAVCRPAGCEELVDETLLGFALVTARRGALAQAARLAGAAAHLKSPSRSHDEATIWERLEELLEVHRKSYGTESWDRITLAAASLTAHDAINFALARGQS